MADLDVDRIAAAALAVADDQGASAFTMRAVADELGVTPMALYHHVADKSALVGLVVEAVVRERPLPPPTDDWREDLWQLARWVREITTAHPAVARLRRAHQVWTPSMLPMTEHWFNLWRQSGLDLDDALRAGATTSMAIIGLVEEEQLFREMVHPDAGALAWAPNARLAFQRNGDPDADFELVVRSLVDGIHARLSGPADQRPVRSPRRP
jgi:AcrR family transcriptional regulator